MKETPIQMFALRPVKLLKIDSNKDVSCEYCELLITSNYFKGHLRGAASAYLAHESVS